MKTWKRCPAASVKPILWRAPGWGRSRRQIARVPGGQPAPARSSVASSATQAPRRGRPSGSTAGCHAGSGSSRIACWTRWSQSNPIENQRLRRTMLGHLSSLQVHHIFPKAYLYKAATPVDKSMRSRTSASSRRRPIWLSASAPRRRTWPRSKPGTRALWRLNGSPLTPTCGSRRAISTSWPPDDGYSRTQPMPSLPSFDPE